MKVILLILVSIVGLGVALYAIFVLYEVCRIGYRYYTDDEYRKDFDAKATERRKKEELEKKQKNKQKHLSSGSLHWLSYPSPLNSWGLWN